MPCQHETIVSHNGPRKYFKFSNKSNGVLCLRTAAEQRGIWKSVLTKLN